MPLEHSGVALTFYAFYSASKAGKTGLTPTVDVWRNQAEIVTDASATEMGDGLYYYTLSAGWVTVEGEYLAVFKTTDATVDQRHIPTIWVVGRAGIEYLDAAVSSRLAASSYTPPPSAGVIADAVLDETLSEHTTPGTVGDALNDVLTVDNPLNSAVPGSYAVGTAGYALGLIGTGKGVVVAPVGLDATVTVHAGADYYASENRRLAWVEQITPWPDLTGATVLFIASRRGQPPHTLTQAGVIVVASGPGKRVEVQLTAAQTNTLYVGKDAYYYHLIATLSNGHIIPLAEGLMTVKVLP